MKKIQIEVRNHAAHEYPEHPEIRSGYLNQLFDLVPVLLTVLSNIKKFYLKKKSR
jgi:hypothetical protein